MRSLITVTSLLLLAACASEPPPTTVAAAGAAPAPAAAASGPKMYCHREKITGSNMTQTICEPGELDNDGAKNVLREWRDQANHSTPPRTGGGGG